MKVKDVMTRDVQLVSPGDTVQEAAQIMADVAAGAVPIGSGRHPEGMLTDRDVLIRLVAEGLDPGATTVREIMSADVLACHEEDDAAAAADLMRQRQIRRMPVLDGEDYMVGIVTLSDIARRIPAEGMSRAEELREAAGDKPTVPPDAAAGL